MTRYVVIGAGAIGGSIGGLLTRSGADAVLVARGAHEDALVADGLRLRTPDEDVHVQVVAARTPQEVDLRDDDVLVLSTKTQQAEVALAVWTDQPVGDATAGERLPVLVATNGIAAEDIALRYFRRVYGVCVWMPTMRLEPGEAVVKSAPVYGVFHVGRVPAHVTEADDSFLDRVRADWDRAGLVVHTPPDVMAWKRHKLITNLRNGISALVGSGDAGRVADAVRAEGFMILDAAGLDYMSVEEERGLRAEGPHPREVPGLDYWGSSTWQSLARATGNVETDYLNGEVVRIAHAIGREAPLNAAVARLVRRAVAEGWDVGHLSAEELSAQVVPHEDAREAT